MSVYISGRIVTEERLIFLCGLKFRNSLRMESKLHHVVSSVNHAVGVLKTVNLGIIIVRMVIIDMEIMPTLLQSLAFCFFFLQ